MNDNDEEASSQGRTIQEQAEAWLAYLRGPEDPDRQEAFNRWIVGAPEHRRALERAAGAFDGAEILKRSGKFGTGARENGRKTRSKPLIMTGLAAAAALAIVVAGTLSLSPSNRGRPTAIVSGSIEANHGKIRTIRLADGSTVTLDADSRVDIALTGAERRLRLLAGRARFQVAHEDRPFIVEASNGTVTARGTIFDVTLDGPAGVTVQLIEGKVDVATTGTSRTRDNQPPVHKLVAGEAVSYRADSVAPVSVPSPGTTDWPRGFAEFRRISLGELIAQANRYAERPLVLDDPTLAEINVAGRFRLTDTEHLANRIAELSNLSVRKAPDGIHLDRR